MADIFKLFLVISVMASIMIGIILIIRRVFSNKMSPAVMLLLWGMVLLRLILPFTISSPVQLASIFPQQTHSTNANNESISRGDLMSDANPVSNNNLNLIDTNTNPRSEQETPQTPAEATNVEPTVVTLGDLLKTIPWWNILAAAWMAGIATTLLLSIWKGAQFKRKLRFCNPVADKKVLNSIQVRKKETGVKKAVEVLECNFVHAPAVFGYFKPYILIPSRFLEEMDRDSLNAILLHEIYHIRCHDILTNYIWLAAKALHWFNPLVWFAYKWFEDDVELRRDQKAAHVLEVDGSFVYSKSLLEAARFSRQTTFIPSSAAALFENNCKLKQRIVRLVKPQRKTKSAPIVSTLLAMLMIIACFTTACQPTPETQVVIGRQQDVISEITSVPSGDFKQIEAPEHISEIHDDYPYLKISYDADVVVPETTAYPVTEMTKKVFSDDDIMSFIDLKDNIISNIGFKVGGNGFSYTRDEFVEVNPASHMADSMYEKNMDGPIENYRWRQPGEPDISQEEAYAIALQYKDALGIDLDLYSAEPCSFIKDVYKTTGWQFTFMRRISNLRAIDDTGGFSWDPNTPPSYVSPWGEEKLTISVDKDGLFSLWLRGASMVSRTVTGSAQLLDFDTIHQRVTDQLNYLCGTGGDSQKKVFQIKITKIELGVSMLSLENKTDIGEYIPTWYVTYKCGFEEEKEDSWEIQQIMFSAIDGSYVEPRLSNEDLMGKMDTGSDSADVPGPVPTK